MIARHEKKISIVLLIPICLFAYTQKYSEYEVKAAFLEKFTRFVEWPDNTDMGDIKKPFIIGIIGKSPFGSILEKMYNKQTIKNKKVEIHYLPNINKIADCHLLYISQSEYKRIDQIVSAIKEAPILTIGDDKRYSKKGVQIILFVESNHIYFEIDQDAVNLSGLYMNSLLLKMSRTINSGEGKQ